MKKVIPAIVLAIIISLSLCLVGCGNSQSSNSSAVKQKVESAAIAQAKAHYILAYSGNGSPSVSVTSVKGDSSPYSVYGTVAIRDNYNKTFTAQWNMTVRYDEASGKATTSNESYGTPTG